MIRGDGGRTGSAMGVETMIRAIRAARTLLAAASIAATIASTGAAVVPGTEDPAWSLVLARVDGRAITLGEIRESFATRHEGHGSLLAGATIIRQVIDKAIDERLLIQEGERMGIPEEPGFDHACERYRDVILLEEFRRRRIDRSAEATDPEIEAAYARLPRRVRLRMIETRTEMEAREARLRVTLGESFDDVARLLSVDGSRTRGGDLGWVSWGMLDEETERVALAMSAGGLSEPFPIGGKRFRLLSLVEEQTAEPPPLEKVRERLQAIIRQRKRGAVEEQVLAGIRASHPPVVDEAAVMELLAPPTEASVGGAEPPDDAVLVETAGGLKVTAGQVRRSAATAHLALGAAWQAARDEALMLDEARRLLRDDGEIERRTRLYGDGMIRVKVEQVILAGITVDEEAVRALYDQAPAAFSGPASFRLRHIVLATEDEARDVARRIEAGEDFEALAREKSIDTATAPQGGDMGWIDGPAGAPDARTGVFALAPGATSGVIRSDLGFSIVRMIEVREAPVPAWGECKEEAAKRYLGRERQRLREEFIGRLRQAAQIEILEKEIPRAVRIQDEAIRRRTGGSAS